MSGRRVVFLDRDGTINRDVGYPGHPDQIRLFEQSVAAVRRLKDAGFAVVVITNQSGVGRGYFNEAELARVNGRVAGLFAAAGAPLDGIYYCPHFRGSAEPVYDRDCDCRKPRPGLGLRAARDLGLTFEGSFMVGDKAEDIRLGLNLGVRPVLVLTGYGRRAEAELKDLSLAPAFVAPTIAEAADWICAQAAAARGPASPTGPPPLSRMPGPGGAKD